MPEIEEEAPTKGKKSKTEADAPADAVKKPYGQNVGDIVDACDATGGRYEAVGAGKVRRVE